MSYFFQHPFGLSAEQRMANLQRKMWFEGTGIFWYIFEKLRLGGGKYPLDSLLLAANGSEPRQRKIQRVLSDFDLFAIENGMVSLQSGLSVADLLPKRRISPQDKVAEIRQRIYNGYDDNLFPDDCKEMDESALVRTQQEIRMHNAVEISQFS